MYWVILLRKRWSGDTDGFCGETKTGDHTVYDMLEHNSLLVSAPSGCGHFIVSLCSLQDRVRSQTQPSNWHGTKLVLFRRMAAHPYEGAHRLCTTLLSRSYLEFRPWTRIPSDRNVGTLPSPC